MHTLARHFAPPVAPPPTAPELSPLYLARLCSLAYENPWIIRGQMPELVDCYDYFGDYACPRCRRRVAVDTQAQLYRLPANHYVLAFRGSDSVVDWAANLDHRACHQYGLPLHAGFLHGYEAIRSLLDAELTAPAAITVTGHSKGGGEAVPAAVDLYLRHGGDVPVRVVTFGAPRVARQAYAQAFESLIPTVRYLNGPDPVPWLPPLTLGFRHLGSAIQLQTPWWRVSRWWHERRDLFRRFHTINAYLNALESFHP